MTLFQRVRRRLKIRWRLRVLIEKARFALGELFWDRSLPHWDGGGELHWNGTGMYRLVEDYEPPDLARFDPDTVGPVGEIALTEGWTLTRGEGALEVEEGRLRVTTASIDAEVGRAVDFPADSVTALRLTMQVTRGNQAQLRWRRREHPDQLAGMQEVWLRPGPAVQRYRVAVGDDPAWRGHVVELRLRPSNVTNGAVALIEEIALERDSLAQQLAASYQSVRQVKIGPDMRRVLFAPTPTVIERRLRLPKNAVLQLGFGVMQRSWWAERGPVRFQVTLAVEGGDVVDLLGETIWLQEAVDRWHWYDREIDLSDLAGRRVTLRLETSRGRAGGPVFTVWSDPCLFSREARQDPRPNVLLISVDTLRADRLGCYGYDRPTSPEIDRLAAGAVRFQRAISQSTWTLPSHLSLLTGRYPLEYGDTNETMRPRPGIPHLSELLGQAGYATGAVIGGGYVSTAFGFARGFDRYLEQTDIERFSQSACEWIEANARRPFFLFLHTYEVHNYYSQFEHYLSMFEAEPYHGKVRPGFDFPAAMTRLGRGEGGLDDADIRRVNALYDGEVRCADAALGRIFAALREAGLMERTLVILLSDHGEELAEHAQFAHFGPMHEEVIRVPLIVAPPAGPGAAAGRAIDGVVELTDVAPTILEAVGLPVPEFLVGRSLWPALRGHQQPSDRIAFSEGHGARWALSSADWKYESLVRPLPLLQDERLFDLRSDRAEARNVVAQFPDVAAEYRGRLLELAARLARGYRVWLAPKEPITLRLRSSAPVRYLQVPALSRGNALAVSEDQRALEVRLSRPEAVLMILGLDKGATLRVAADSGGRPLEASQIHLGATGAHPPAVPFTVGADVPFTALEAERRPPYADRPDTAIWLWRPAAEEAGEAPPPDVDSETRKQLRALGYVD